VGIAEVAVFKAAQQLCQAGSAYLGAINPPPTNPWAAAACVVGKKLLDNAAKGFGWAVDAAKSELDATQLAEKKVGQQLTTLPDIT